MKFLVFRSVKIAVLSLLVFALATPSLLAQNRTVNTSGNWNSAAIWNGGTAADVADIIGENASFGNDLGGSGMVTFPSPLNYTVGNVSMGNGNDLTISTGATLNIGNAANSRSLTVGNDGRIFVNGTLIIWGNFDPGNNFQITIGSTGTLIVKGSYLPGNDSRFTSSGTVDVDGAFTLGNNNRITLSGPMDVGGNLTFGNDAIVLLNSPADLEVTGNFDGGNNGRFTADSGTNVDIGGFFDLGNDARVVANGDMDVTGNFQLGSTPRVTVGSGGDLDIGGNMSANNDGIYTIDGEMNIGGGFNGGTNSDFDVDGLVTIVNNINVGNDSNAVGTGSIMVGGGCSDGNSNFCGQGPFLVMPIRLAYFNAVLNEAKDQSILSWATEKEESFDHFEIEYAGSDLQFSKLTSVQGSGANTQSLKKYSWIHTNPIIGDNYYRLKAVDIDGSFEYFDIKHVVVETSKELFIYPNPSVDGRVSYKINFEPTSGSRIVIVNGLGNQLKGIEVSSTEGELTFSQPLQSGIYYVQYVSNQFTKTLRLVVR